MQCSASDWIYCALFYKHMKNTHTLVRKILLLVLLISSIPLILVVFIGCSIWSDMMISKTDELMNSKMNTAQKSLEDYFNIYSNIIMEIYTNETLVDSLEKLNLYDVNNSYLIKNQIETEFENIVYLHQDMMGLGIYSQKNDFIFCDAQTSMNTRSVCFSKENQIWQQLAKDVFDCTGMIYSEPVELKMDNNEKKQVIYMAHRVTDFSNYSRGTRGSIVICLDEERIRQIYSPESETDSQVSFLCSKDGTIVSCSKPGYIGKSAWFPEQISAKKDITDIVKETAVKMDMAASTHCSIYLKDIQNTEFTLITMQNQHTLLKDMHYVVICIVLIGIMTFLISALITLRFAEKINSSIWNIISAMDQAYNGNYHVQIESSNDYAEFATISRHFNHMVNQIEISGKRERDALIREKNAEIAALEAQINPHFLYNTLDAINWVAIDNEQFLISKMLKDLAIILRYSIQNSNSMVSVSNEIEYLKKYILLQQQRFEFSFQCFMDFREEVMNYQVHKLLFQPLIENAIVHGFPGKHSSDDMDTIWISAKRVNKDGLEITVKDNGRGMDPALVDELNHFDYKNNSVKTSIGIRNVFMRVKYYYGEHGNFRVWSDTRGTQVTLWINCKPENPEE